MSDSVRPHRRQPTSSPLPGILQARTLEWVAISFSNAWKWKVRGKSLSRVRLLATPWTAAYQAPPSIGFSRQEYWSGVPLPSPKDIPPLLKNQTRNSLHNNIRVPPTAQSYFLTCHTSHPNQLLVWVHPIPFIYSIPDAGNSVSICFAHSTQVTPIHTF